MRLDGQLGQALPLGPILCLVCRRLLFVAVVSECALLLQLLISTVFLSAFIRRRWQWLQQVLQIAANPCVDHHALELLVLFEEGLQPVALHPVVLKGVVRLDPLLGVDDQTFLDEVNEVVICLGLECPSDGVAPIRQVRSHATVLRS